MSTKVPSAPNQTITFVGGGNMGAALVAGLIRAGWSAGSITVAETSDDRRATLGDMFPGVLVVPDVAPCERAVIAVKPAAAGDVCAQLAAGGARRVLSIAAGVSSEVLQARAGDGCAVVRSMPNTPALVGEGVSAICGSSQCTEEDLSWAETVLGAVGTVVRVDESLIDSVTAISGSGPAYLFLFAEALVDAGVEQGLPRDVADALVRQLLLGSGRLLQQSGEEPAELRRKVTSPNGVTAAAIASFESEGFRESVARAVRSAVERSREMGR